VRERLGGNADLLRPAEIDVASALPSISESGDARTACAVITIAMMKNGTFQLLMEASS
jgi:hypothetical protein